MAIPKFHEFMLPFLKRLKNGDVVPMDEMREFLANELKISEKQQEELLPSGKGRVFRNRVGWSRTYLKKAGLISVPTRGCYQITDRGRSVLEENINEITVNYLKQFDEFLEFQTTSHKADSKDGLVSSSDETPLEQIESAFNEINESLSKEILDNISNCSPFYFERIVVDVLLNLGYGGSRKEAGEAFATSSDGGIDGVIKEDKLGLDVIYIQAKRWKEGSTVGRPEIQKFVGAIHGRRAKKGVFITTSHFSNDAIEYVKTIDSKIILIDGKNLARLMIESKTGVTLESTYEICKIDSDYFSDEL